MDANSPNFLPNIRNYVIEGVLTGRRDGVIDHTEQERLARVLKRVFPTKSTREVADIISRWPDKMTWTETAQVIKSINSNLGNSDEYWLAREILLRQGIAIQQTNGRYENIGTKLATVFMAQICLRLSTVGMQLNLNAVNPLDQETATALEAEWLDILAAAGIDPQDEARYDVFNKLKLDYDSLTYEDFVMLADFLFSNINPDDQQAVQEIEAVLYNLPMASDPQNTAIAEALIWAVRARFYMSVVAHENADESGYAALLQLAQINLKLNTMSEEEYQAEVENSVAEQRGLIWEQDNLLRSLGWRDELDRDVFYRELYGVRKNITGADSIEETARAWDRVARERFVSLGDGVSGLVLRLAEINYQLNIMSEEEYSSSAGQRLESERDALLFRLGHYSGNKIAFYKSLYGDIQLSEDSTLEEAAAVWRGVIREVTVRAEFTPSGEYNYADIATLLDNSPSIYAGPVKTTILADTEQNEHLPNGTTIEQLPDRTIRIISIKDDQKTNRKIETERLVRPGYADYLASDMTFFEELTNSLNPLRGEREIGMVLSTDKLVEHRDAILNRNFFMRMIVNIYAGGETILLQAFDEKGRKNDSALTANELAIAAAVLRGDNIKVREIVETINGFTDKISRLTERLVENLPSTSRLAQRAKWYLDNKIPIPPELVFIYATEAELQLLGEDKEKYKNLYQAYLNQMYFFQQLQSYVSDPEYAALNSEESQKAITSVVGRLAAGSYYGMQILFEYRTVGVKEIQQLYQEYAETSGLLQHQDREWLSGVYATSFDQLILPFQADFLRFVLEKSILTNNKETQRVDLLRAVAGVGVQDLALSHYSPLNPDASADGAKTLSAEQVKIKIYEAFLYASMGSLQQINYFATKLTGNRATVAWRPNDWTNDNDLTTGPVQSLGRSMRTVIRNWGIGYDPLAERETDVTELRSNLRYTLMMRDLMRNYPTREIISQNFAGFQKDFLDFLQKMRDSAEHGVLNESFAGLIDSAGDILGFVMTACPQERLLEFLKQVQTLLLPVQEAQARLMRPSPTLDSLLNNINVLLRVYEMDMAEFAALEIKDLSEFINSFGNATLPLEIGLIFAPSVAIPNYGEVYVGEIDPQIQKDFLLALMQCVLFPSRQALDMVEAASLRLSSAIDALPQDQRGNLQNARAFLEDNIYRLIENTCRASQLMGVEDEYLFPYLHTDDPDPDYITPIRNASTEPDVDSTAGLVLDADKYYEAMASEFVNNDKYSAYDPLELEYLAGAMQHGQAQLASVLTKAEARIFWQNVKARYGADHPFVQKYADRLGYMNGSWSYREHLQFLLDGEALLHDLQLPKDEIAKLLQGFDAHKAIDIRHLITNHHDPSVQKRDKAPGGLYRDYKDAWEGIFKDIFSATSQKEDFPFSPAAVRKLRAAYKIFAEYQSGTDFEQLTTPQVFVGGWHLVSGIISGEDLLPQGKDPLPQSEPGWVRLPLEPWRTGIELGARFNISVPLYVYVALPLEIVDALKDFAFHLDSPEILLRAGFSLVELVSWRLWIGNWLKDIFDQIQQGDWLGAIVDTYMMLSIGQGLLGKTVRLPLSTVEKFAQFNDFMHRLIGVEMTGRLRDRAEEAVRISQEKGEHKTISSNRFWAEGKLIDIQGDNRVARLWNNIRNAGGLGEYFYKFKIGNTWHTVMDKDRDIPVATRIAKAAIAAGMTMAKVTYGAELHAFNYVFRRWLAVPGLIRDVNSGLGLEYDNLTIGIAPARKVAFEVRHRFIVRGLKGVKPYALHSPLHLALLTPELKNMARAHLEDYARQFNVRDAQGNLRNVPLEQVRKASALSAEQRDCLAEYLSVNSERLIDLQAITYIDVRQALEAYLRAYPGEVFDIKKANIDYWTKFMPEVGPNVQANIDQKYLDPGADSDGQRFDERLMSAVNAAVISPQEAQANQNAGAKWRDGVKQWLADNKNLPQDAVKNNLWQLERYYSEALYEASRTTGDNITALKSQLALDLEVIKQYLNGKEVIAAELVAGGGKTITGILGMRILTDLMNEGIIQPKTPIVYVVPQRTLLKEVQDAGKTEKHLLDLLFGSRYRVIDDVDMRMERSTEKVDIQYISLDVLFFKFIKGEALPENITYFWDEFDKYFFLDSSFISTAPTKQLAWTQFLEKYTGTKDITALGKSIESKLDGTKEGDYGLFARINEIIRAHQCESIDAVRGYILTELKPGQALTEAEKAQLDSIIRSVYQARGLYNLEGNNPVFRESEMGIERGRGLHHDKVFLKPGGEVSPDLKMNYEDNIRLKIALDMIWEQNKNNAEFESRGKISLNVAEINNTLMKIGLPQLFHNTAGRIIGLTGTLNESMGIIRPFLDRLSTLRQRALDCYFFHAPETFPTLTLKTDTDISLDPRLTEAFQLDPAALLRKLNSDADLRRLLTESVQKQDSKVLLELLKLPPADLAKILAKLPAAKAALGDYLMAIYAKYSGDATAQGAFKVNAEGEELSAAARLNVNENIERLLHDAGGSGLDRISIMEFRGVTTADTRSDSLKLAAERAVAFVLEINDRGEVIFKGQALLDWNKLGFDDVEVLKSAVLEQIRALAQARGLTEITLAGQCYNINNEQIDRKGDPVGADNILNLMKIIFVSDIDARGKPRSIEGIKAEGTRLGRILALSWANRGTDFKWTVLGSTTLDVQNAITRLNSLLGIEDVTRLRPEVLNKKAKEVGKTEHGKEALDKLAVLESFMVRMSGITGLRQSEVLRLAATPERLVAKLAEKGVDYVFCENGKWEFNDSYKSLSELISRAELTKLLPGKNIDTMSPREIQNALREVQNSPGGTALIREALAKSGRANVFWDGKKSKLHFDPYVGILGFTPLEANLVQIIKRGDRFDKGAIVDYFVSTKDIDDYLVMREREPDIDELRAEWEKIKAANKKDPAIVFIKQCKDKIARIEADKVSQMNKEILEDLAKNGVTYALGARNYVELYHLALSRYADICINMYKEVLATKAEPAEGVKAAMSALHRMLGGIAGTQFGGIGLGQVAQAKLEQRLLADPDNAESIIREFFAEYKGKVPYFQDYEGFLRQAMRLRGLSAGEAEKFGLENSRRFEILITQLILRSGGKGHIYTPDELPVDLPQRALVVVVRDAADLAALKAYYDGLITKANGPESTAKDRVRLQMFQEGLTVCIKNWPEAEKDGLSRDGIEALKGMLGFLRTEQILNTGLQDTAAQANADRIKFTAEVREQAEGILSRYPDSEHVFGVLIDSNNRIVRIVEPEASRVLDMNGKSLFIGGMRVQNDVQYADTLKRLHTQLLTAQTADDPVEWVKANILGVYGRDVDNMLKNLTDEQIRSLETLEWKNTCGFFPAFDQRVQSIAKVLGVEGRIAHNHDGAPSRLDQLSRMDVLSRPASPTAPPVYIRAKPAPSEANEPRRHVADRVSLENPARLAEQSGSEIHSTSITVQEVQTNVRTDPAIRSTDVLRSLEEVQLIAPEQSQIRLTEEEVRTFAATLTSEEAAKCQEMARAVLEDPNLRAIGAHVDRLRGAGATETGTGKNDQMLRLALHQYEEQSKKLSEGYRAAFTNTTLGEKLRGFWPGVNERIDAAQGAFILGVAMSAWKTFRREDLTLSQKFNTWLTGIGTGEETGFGIFCSFRDNILTDFSLRTINRLFNTNIMDVSTLAQTTVQAGRAVRGLNRNSLHFSQVSSAADNRRAYAQGCGKYLAAVAPALFAAGFLLEGIPKALQNPAFEALACSEDPYDQEKFLAALLITMAAEGTANVLYELPTMLSAVCPIFRGAGGALVSFLRSGFGVGAVMIGGQLIQNFVAGPEIARVFAEIDRRRETNEERKKNGLPPINEPSLITPEELANRFNALTRASSILSNLTTSFGRAFLDRFIVMLPQNSLNMLSGISGKLAVRGLGSKGLAAFSARCAALAGSKIATKVVPVVGWVLVGIEAVDFLSASIEELVAPDPKNMSMQSYAAMDHTMSVYDMVDIRGDKGLRDLPFEIAQKLARSGYLDMVREELRNSLPETAEEAYYVQGRRCTRTMYPRRQFDEQWSNMLAALNSNNINMLKNWWNTAPVISSIVRIIGMIPNHGRTGDGTVATEWERGVQNKATFFEFVMSKALMCFYADNVDSFSGSPELLTESNTAVTQSYQNVYLGILREDNKNAAKLVWRSLYAGWFATNNVRYVPVAPGASTQRPISLTQEEQETRFLEYMRAQGINIDPATWTCADIEKREDFSYHTYAMGKDLLTNGRFFANNKDIFLDFMIWVIVEQNTTPLGYNMASHGYSVSAVWERDKETLLTYIACYRTHTPLEKPVGEKRAGDTVTFNELINFLENMANRMSFNVPGMLKNYFAQRMRQAGAQSAVDDLASLTANPGTWNLSLARTDNATSFIQDTLAVLTHLTAVTATPPRASTLSPEQVTRLQPLINYWQGKSSAERQAMQHYLNGRTGMPAVLKSGDLSLNSFLRGATIGRTTMRLLDQVNGLRAGCMRCRVSPQQDGLNAVYYFMQVLKSSGVPETAWPKLLGGFLYANGLTEDSALQSGKIMYLDLAVVPAHLRDELTVAIRSERKNNNMEVSPEEIISALNVSERYNTTEVLLNNIYNEEALLSYLWEGEANQTNRQLLLDFAEKNHIALPLRATERNARERYIDLATYRKIIDRLQTMGLVEPNTRMADVLNVLAGYQDFCARYDRTELGIANTAEIFAGLQVDGKPFLSGDITPEKLYNSYIRLAGVINTACGKEITNVNLLLSQISFIQYVKDNTPQGTDCRTMLLATMRSYGYPSGWKQVGQGEQAYMTVDYGNQLDGGLAESLLLIMEGHLPTRATLQTIGLPKCANGEENLDAFLIISGVLTREEALANQSVTASSGRTGVNTNYLRNAFNRLDKKHYDLIADGFYQMSLLPNKPAYFWKVEALILKSPDLVQALLERGYDTLLESCVDSRMRYPDTYRASLDATVAVLDREANGDQASLAYISAQTLRGISATRDVRVTNRASIASLAAQGQWNDSGAGPIFTVSGIAGTQYRLGADGRIYWKDSKGYGVSGRITVSLDGAYSMDGKDGYQIVNGELRVVQPVSRTSSSAIATPPVSTAGAAAYRLLVKNTEANTTFTVSGFRAESGIGNVRAIKVNDVNCVLEGTGANNRVFVYNDQSYTLSYVNGWFIQKN